MARDSRRCNGCCELGSDEFDRSDLGDLWPIVAGAPSIVAGRLSLNAGDKLYYENGLIGDPSVGKRYTFLLTPNDDVELLTWILDGTDFQNGVYAGFECGSQSPVVDQEDCDEIGFELAVSGNPTQIDVCAQTQPVLWMEAGRAHEVEVCWFPATYPEESVIRVKVRVAKDNGYGQTFIAQASVATTIEATNFGFDLSQGSCFIDNFEVWALESVCPETCPKCHGPCRIFEDDFTRGASGDPGCAWDDSLCDAAIASAKMQVRTSGVVRCRMRHHLDGTDHFCDFHLHSPEVSVRARAVVNCQCDTQRYYAAELERLFSGNYILRVIKYDNGATTTLDESEEFAWTGGPYMIIRACIDGSTITGQAIDPGGGLAAAPETVLGSAQSTGATPHPEGVWAGIGSGYAGRYVNASHFRFYRHQDADFENCPDCTSGQVGVPPPPVGCCCPNPAGAYAVDIGSGLINGCHDGCDDVEGEWIIPYCCQFFPPGGAAWCEWRSNYLVGSTMLGGHFIPPILNEQYDCECVGVPAGGGGCNKPMAISLQLILCSPGSPLPTPLGLWSLVVTVTAGWASQVTFPSDPSITCRACQSGTRDVTVVYSSIGYDDCDASQWTLHRQTEGIGWLCGGNFPATITLRPVV